MVSIKLVWDGGIITHAKNATSKYTIEQEKELIAKGYSEYKMEKYTPEKLPEGLESLNKNFLNKRIDEIYDESKSTNETVVLVSGDIELSVSDSYESEDNIYADIHFEYNGNRYKMTVKLDTGTIQNIEFLASKKIIVLKVDGADDIVGNEIIGWNITFNETKHEYFLNGEGQITNETEIQKEDLDLLERYFLGEGKTGINFADIVDDNNNFKNNEIMPNANKDLLTIGIPVGTNDTWGIEHCTLYVKYKDKAVYKLICDTDGTENTKKWITNSISLAYSPRGREGQKIEFAPGPGHWNEKEKWTILYDYGDSVEILAPGALENFNITGIEGYNNAFSIMNSYLGYEDAPNIISARCAGSNPKDSSKDHEIFWKPEEGECSYNLKREDINYDKDFARMAYYGILEIDKNSSYWIPSRSCYFDNKRADFYIKRYQYGQLYEENIVTLEKDDNNKWNANEHYTGNIKYGVRPIVKLNASSVEVIK